MLLYFFLVLDIITIFLIITIRNPCAMWAIKKSIFTNVVHRLLERRDRVISVRCREHLARPIHAVYRMLQKQIRDKNSQSDRLCKTETLYRGTVLNRTKFSSISYRMIKVCNLCDTCITNSKIKIIEEIIWKEWFSLSELKTMLYWMCRFRAVHDISSTLLKSMKLIE